MQQDRFLPEEDWNGTGTFCVGVADGHGKNGDFAAGFATQMIPVFLRLNGYSPECPQEPMQHAFRMVDARIKLACDGGTTFVFADVSSQHIVIAHAGDARAALVSRHTVTELTCDHQGKCGRITRSLGDRVAPHISCEPDVHVIKRPVGSHWLLLGSDELWRALDDRLIVSRVLASTLNKPTAFEAREALRELLWDDPQVENVTAFLYDLSLPS